MRRGTGNRKPKAQDDVAEKQRQQLEAECWRLRTDEVLSYREIAERLQRSIGWVCETLTKRRSVNPEREKYVAEANAELEPVMVAMRDQALMGDTQAANALAKLCSLHADLNGYRAPTKTELSGPNGGPIDVRAAQDELLGRLAKLAPSTGAGTSDPKPDG